MNESVNLSAAQKKFLLRTVKYLVENGQVLEGRQLLLRFIGYDVITDEEFTYIEDATDRYEENKG